MEAKRPCNDRVQIGRDAERFIKWDLFFVGRLRASLLLEHGGCPAALFLDSLALLLDDGLVRDHRPIALSHAREAPSRFEVGLVETGEDVVAEISLELRIDILLAVDFVCE